MQTRADTGKKKVDTLNKTVLNGISMGMTHTTSCR